MHLSAMNKEDHRRRTHRLGADLVGFAAADRFAGAPTGNRPADVLPSCRTVIVMACEFPAESLSQDYIGYTRTRNAMAEKMNRMGEEVARMLQAEGHEAKPIISIAASIVDGRYRGPISLKHAAELAGLGRIGKNTLLINDRFGNMIWLGATLTDLSLESDPPAAYTTCPEGCTVCMDACPVAALGQPAMEQMSCFRHAFRITDGNLEIHCRECRQRCPLHRGLAHRAS